MKDRKIGIISQARMTSTRLPGKVLKEIDGVSLLKYHVDRLKKANIPIFIATTTNSTDDPIVEFCKKEGITSFRGKEDNVLERYYLCAKKYDLDIIIRVTSDCPLIDGGLIKSGLERYLALNDEYLYLSNTIGRSFPRGLDFEVFSFKLLKEAFDKATLKLEREHVTPYLYQGKNPLIQTLGFIRDENKGEYRITVDTVADFELIETLIHRYKAHLKNTAQIIDLLNEHPELVRLNAHVEQKKLAD